MDLFVLKTWLEARFNVRDERGANLVEYVLLLAFIALVVIGIVKLLGGRVSQKFSDASSNLG
jgi:Flp pilus assembly pilin Flp